MNYPSIRLEGAILTADLLDAIAREDKHSQKPADFGLDPSSKVKDEIASTWASAKALWTGYQAKIANLREGQTGVSETRNLFALPLLALLGYQPEKAEAETLNGKSYAISHRDISRDGFPLHIMGWHDSLEKKRTTGGPRISAHALVQEYLNLTEHLYGIITNGRQLRLLRDSSRLIKLSFLEFDLNRIFEEDLYADFAILFRLIHATRMPANRANASGSVIEKYHQESVDSGSRIRDGLAAAVAFSMQTVANGLLAHPANASLVEQLKQEPVRANELHQNLLRWVYRTLFVLVIEERVLHHAPTATLRQRQLYRDYYSLQRLRRLADRPQLADRRAHDLWRAMHQTLRLYEDGGKGLPLGIAPLGSFLFREEGLQQLFQYQLDNRSLLQALNRLSTFTHPDTNVRMRVNYGALDVEEFGSVYESLLELRPRIIPEAETVAFSYAQLAGNDRKTSGSYYTPDSLVQCLLDSALDPVIEERLNGKKGQEAEKALLSIKVCDPAVGSGHFLIGAAHRLAQRLADIRAGDEALSPDVQRHALRDVVSRCLYGVDINPLSVELCKVSLWMLGMEPGKPLGFLDHHIRCGNSLLGATPELIRGGIPEAAYDPIEGDDKAACTALKRQNKRENPKLGEMFIADEAILRDKLFKAAAAIDDIGDSRPEDVRRKETTFAANQQNYDFRKAWDMADLWCAAIVIKKRFPESAHSVPATGSAQSDNTTPGAVPLPAWFGVTDESPKSKAKGGKASSLTAHPSINAWGITTQNLRDFAGGGALPDGLLAEAKGLADRYQFFHWHLAFPEVFPMPTEAERTENEHVGRKGGFDIILGNPPWERVKLQEKEWFAEKLPEIANAPNAAARKRLIQQLREQHPQMFTSFTDDVRKADGEAQIMRSDELYPLCGCGDMNTYALFAERCYYLLSPRGFFGLVLPTGLVTGDNTKAFFGELMRTKRLRAFIGFDNEEKQIFPDIDNNLTFAAVVVGADTGTKPKFCFNIRRFDQLKETDRFFELSDEDLTLLNPNTRTCPIFRSSADGELVRRIYARFPLVWLEVPREANTWGIQFLRMFDMASDSNFFISEEQLQARGAQRRLNTFAIGDETFSPLFEAKMIWHFEHRWAAFYGREMTDGRPSRKYVGWYGVRYQQPDDLAFGRYWVADTTLRERIGPDIRYFVAFRDITNRDLERTAVFTILPALAVGHQAPVVRLPGKSAADLACFVAERNSFVADYVTRNKIDGSHLTYFVFKQLPVVPPATYAEPCAWAGRPVVPLRDWLLPRVLELTYTAWDLEPFAQDSGCFSPPFVWDEDRRFQLRCELDAAFLHLYGLSRTDADYILDTFPIVKRKDEAKFNGDFRTKRVILENYDALTESMQTGKAYQTRLNPSPADPRCCHAPKQTDTISAESNVNSRLVGRSIDQTPSTPVRRAGTLPPTARDRIGSPDLEGAVGRFDFSFPSTPRPSIATTAELFTLLLPALVQEAGGQLDYEEFLEALAFLSNPPKSSATLPTHAAPQFVKWRAKYPSNLVDANALKAALHDHIAMRKMLGIISDGNNFVLFKGIQWVDMTLDWLLFDARLALAHAVKTQTVDPPWARAVAERDLKAWATA